MSASKALMTLTVYEVDANGAVRKVSTKSTRLDRETAILEPSLTRWPPCRCPRHPEGVVLEP